MAALLGVRRYSDPTPPEPWGLTAVERESLRQVVQGDIATARQVAETYLWGCKPARPPIAPDPWTFRMRRTREGAECVFLGPWPNPNKPARAASQILADGTWLGLQPAVGNRRPGPAAGYRVWFGDGQIWAESEQSHGPHSIPELGGRLLWEIWIRGTEIRFSQDAQAA